MDANNWRPTQGAEPTMDTSDWRAQLPPDSRHRIVNKIMETLKRHLPVSGQEGLHELQKIAQRFEEKIYTAATSQSDYLRKISLKMLTMETKSQNTMAANSNKPPDPGLGMQSQVHNPGQSHPFNLANQAQSRQQLLSQNIQTNITPSGVPSSAGIAPGLTPVSNEGQTPIQNVVPQQNISGQNSVGNTIGQGVPSNMFANSQRQMPGRQQVLPQQQQPQSQTPQYLYQQQLLKQKLQQGNVPHQLIQSHMQQQNLLPSNQLQSSQQSVMQSSMTQSSSLSSLPQNQQSNNVQQSAQSMLQQHQHPQSVIRHQQQHQQQQASMIHQQQTSMTQQPILPPQQQQQQHMGQQSNATNMQHTSLLGQQNSVGDMQQQQRLLGQQNNLTNLQQQQQLLNQQNNLSNMHQQQLGSNVPGLQQQQLIGSQSGNSGMQASQHSSHLLQVQQSKVPMQQQSQQNASNLLPSQGLQSQPQAPQQQMTPQIQSQPAQLQQQLGLQQQLNTLQQDMQQRLQASGSLLQLQNLLDQQKQLYKSQRALPETSSTSLDSTAQTGQPSGGDWQEEVYQKIKIMKEMYLPELTEMYQKIAAKLQQHDSLLQQPKSDQLEKLKIFKTMLERIIAFLQVSKSSILPSTKEKLSSYEKQIVNFINTNKPRKAMPLLQGPLSQHHMHSMQQPQSQVTLVPSNENQMNSQLQSTNLEGSVATMLQNNMTNLQHNSMSSIPGVSTAQQNMMNSMQSGANLDSGQGHAMNSLQQVAVSSLQKNPVSMPQQPNINALTSSQDGVNVLQPNLNPLQPGSSMLQHQQEQMLQTQQLKQFQQRQIQQQYRQQILQQQHQQQQQQQQLQQPSKQQMPAQLQTHQMPQFHQMNEMNDIKMRQGMSAKPFQLHLPPGQRPAYPHPQLKPGGSFPVSSPQLLQAPSPQIPQHSSPEVDQQNLIPSITKAGTPLHSGNSPFGAPTPSPPLAAPSPMPGDSEKPNSGASSISNAANTGHQHTSGAAAPGQSLAIGTPGISASPLLSEFGVPDGAHGNSLAATSGKSTMTEQPIERLIKAAYQKFVCNPSPSGVCTSMGRLLPDHYNQMMVATNMSDTLSRNSPFLVGIADCSSVEETFGEISKKRCPQLSLFSSMVFIGMVLVIAAVMFSVVLWVVFV